MEEECGKSESGEEFDPSRGHSIPPLRRTLDTPLPVNLLTDEEIGLQIVGENVNFPLPLFRHPMIDIKAGNFIQRVFVDASALTTKGVVEFNVVLSGEVAWCQKTKRTESRATAYYRANNSLRWKRTADVDKFYYIFDRDLTPVGMSFGATFSGEQSFFKGFKKPLKIPIPFFFDGPVILFSDHEKPPCSFQSPFDGRTHSIVPWEDIELDPAEDNRPIIYFNTGNHLMHSKTTNPDMEYFQYSDVIFLRGVRKDADQYGMKKVEDKSSKFHKGVMKLFGIRF